MDFLCDFPLISKLNLIVLCITSWAAQDHFVFSQFHDQPFQEAYSNVLSLEIHCSYDFKLPAFNRFSYDNMFPHMPYL